MARVTNFRRISSSLCTMLAALICVFAGLLIGFLLLFAINPSGSWHGICTIVGNFMYFPKAETQIKYLGLTLEKTAPLIMCSLSVIYANKVGLFNIGVAGQYVAGVMGSLFLALACGMPWYVCVVGGVIAGALSGLVCGALKVLRNVNEVISGILLNWIILYLTNIVLTQVKSASSPYTLTLSGTNEGSILPTLGLDVFFGTPYADIAIPVAVIAAIIVWARFAFTQFGFELKSIGKNKYAARSIGIREKRLTIVAMAIAGGLAGLGGTMLFLSGYEEWMCSQSSVPAMGFNGLAAAFLGGLNPIGSVFSSFFIQQITDGGTYLDTSMYSKEASSFVAAVIIYLCGFMMMIRDWLMKRRNRKANLGDANAPATVAASNASASVPAVGTSVAVVPTTVESPAESCSTAEGSGKTNPGRHCEGGSVVFPSINSSSSEVSDAVADNSVEEEEVRS